MYVKYFCAVREINFRMEMVKQHTGSMLTPLGQLLFCPLFEPVKLSKNHRALCFSPSCAPKKWPKVDMLNLLGTVLVVHGHPKQRKLIRTLGPKVILP